MKLSRLLGLFSGPDAQTPEHTVPPTGPPDWQQRWHEILDSYDDHPDDLDKGEPDPLPEMGSDMRLQFAFWATDWDSGADARRRAFDILPCGPEMLVRVESFLASPRKAIDPDHAETLLREGLKSADAVGVEVPDADGSVRVIGPDGISLHDAFALADDPFLNLSHELPALAEKANGEVGRSAFFFLSDPLYRLASSDDVARWIVWPLCRGQNRDDPTEARYRLWQGGWSAGLDSEGLFLYDRRNEFRLI